MKYAYFVRHGKSSWDAPVPYDHDRPLLERGLKDAQIISSIFKDLNVLPDKICSSSAIRARQTAEIFVQNLEVQDVDYYFELYHAGMHDILHFIAKLDNGINSVMLFGHNPAYTDLINEFSKDYIVNVPTSGAFRIDFSVDAWKDVRVENGELRDYWFPKMYK